MYDPVVTITFICRLSQIIIFIPIIRASYKETTYRDSIVNLRFAILFMILAYVFAQIFQLFVTFCKLSGCFDPVLQTYSNLISALAGLTISVVMYFVYTRRYE